MITTIEGLAVGGQLDVLQRVWIDQDVAQCGYCQSRTNNVCRGAACQQQKTF